MGKSVAVNGQDMSLGCLKDLRYSDSYLKMVDMLKTVFEANVIRGFGPESGSHVCSGTIALCLLQQRLSPLLVSSDPSRIVDSLAILERRKNERMSNHAVAHCGNSPFTPLQASLLRFPLSLRT